MMKSKRLAIVNLDWEHIRASHLYRIVSSLVSPLDQISPLVVPSLEFPEKKPIIKSMNSTRSNLSVTRGYVYSVCIYASEFGKERMRKEELEGPPKDFFISDRIVEAKDNEHEYSQETLRRYQFDRLRYIQYFKFFRFGS